MPYVNDLFFKDNIDYGTQAKFEVGYDEQTNRITIPIRDEIGTLVGVKGRMFGKAQKDGELKYLYICLLYTSQVGFVFRPLLTNHTFEPAGHEQ